MLFGRYILAVFVLLAGSSSWAAGVLQDPTHDPGFNHFFNNEYDEALTYFESEVKANPNDPDQYNHVAQTILYRQLFRNGALESQLVTGNSAFLQHSKVSFTVADRERFRGCIKKSIELSEARIEKDPHDTTAVYELGVAHGLQANYLFLVEKSWIEALREASAARKSEEKVLELNPQFVDARLILGVYEYVVGCLPFYLRAAGFVGGFHGDKEGGVQQLQLVASKSVLNRYDAKILLAVLYRREHRPWLAIPLLQELSRQFERNYLLRFEQVQMYSDLGDKKSALEVLAEIENLRRNGAPGYRDIPEQKVRYVAGNLHFWYGDLDMALADLKQATAHADALDVSTAVMAWLRLGQVYDLQGDHGNAVMAYRASMKAAPGTDAAEEAKGYIANRYKRKPKEEARS
jgi:tetratricopeptide (TPR) repeat protein